MRTWSGHEAGVQQDGRRGDEGGRLGLAEAGEGAPDGRRGNAGEDEGVPERPAADAAERDHHDRGGAGDVPDDRQQPGREKSRCCCASGMPLLAKSPSTGTPIATPIARPA